METNFNNFLILEYTNVEKYRVLGDEIFYTIKYKKGTHNQILTIYNWIKQKDMSIVDFIRLVNIVYSLNINFNTYIIDSKDKRVTELKNIWNKFNNNITFSEFKKSLEKVNKIK